MEISAAELWSGFVAYCGDREPTPELMGDFARVAAAGGNPSTVDLRAGTIVAILRTRAACNRPFESLQHARGASEARPAQNTRHAVIDSSTD